jgi:ethanolamine utilization cobalamin adenosyltransferase
VLRRKQKTAGSREQTADSSQWTADISQQPEYSRQETPDLLTHSSYNHTTSSSSSALYVLQKPEPLTYTINNRTVRKASPRMLQREQTFAVVRTDSFVAHRILNFVFYIPFQIQEIVSQMRTMFS